MIFDGPIAQSEEPPVYYMDRIEQVFPIGSLCKLVTSAMNDEYMLYLRSEIRFEIDPQKYSDM